MPRLLVTGGAGFIGSSLAERLHKTGAYVTVLDNLSTGSLDNIQQLEGESLFRFVQGDACDSSLMDGLVESCDVIFG